MAGYTPEQKKLLNFLNLTKEKYQVFLKGLDY